MHTTADAGPRRGDGRTQRRERSFGGFVLAALVALSACDRAPSDRALPPQAVVVLVGTHPDDPRWQAVRAGAARFGREARRLEIEEILPSSPSPVAQKAAVEKLGRRRLPTVVCVLAISAKILTQPVSRLMAEGVHVVLVGDDAAQTRRHLFVGADEEAMGEVIGKTLVSLCKDHRTVMIAHDDRGDDRSALRHEGLTRTLRLTGDLVILREFDARGEPDKVLKRIRDASERYPSLGGWALLGDWLARTPADRPLVSGSAKVVAYGAYPHSLTLLERGRVDALVDVDWEELGYRALLICHQVLTVSAIPPRDYHAPPVVITPKDLPAQRKKWQSILAAPASQPTAR